MSAFPPARRTRSLAVLVCVGALAVAACSSSGPSSVAVDADEVGSDTTDVPESTAPADTAPTEATTSTTVAPATTTTALPQSDDPFLVNTDLGPVRGTTAGVARVNAFLSIPFAAPPTGDHRFRAPQPHAPWTDEFDATRPGASCPQPTEGITASLTVIPPSDEDCLTLNVWTPDDADNFPVMVWIHGGGLTSGSAHQPYYIGDQLAARGVVLVSMNYRLGPLGFLTTDELIAEAGDDSFGNYGLADQVAALEWVQRNIAGFGGDPNQVTLFGESAGGFSICGHLASPDSDGLFERAIIQSGGGCSRLADPAAAATSGQALLEAVGCPDIACARALPADVLGTASFNAELTADNVALISPALELAEDGAFPDVTVMTGFNADEATLFTLGTDEPDDAQLDALVGAFTSESDALLALYPPDEFETNLHRYQTIWTDVTFGCAALDFATTVPDTYTYHFTYVSAANPFGLGATHGAELAFVFGHPEGIIGLADAFDPESIDVSGSIQQAWVEFAATGSPGADWPSDDDAGKVMVLDNPFELVDTVRNDRCPAVMALIGARP